MTRVLALVTDAWGGYGGIAQYNRDFLSALAAIDDVESVEVLPRLAPESAGPLPQKVAQRRAVLERFSYAGRAVARAVAIQPDVIFSGHLYHGLLARHVARLSNAVLVSQLHGTEIWSPLSPSQRTALEHSDLVLAVSRDTRARALDQVSIDPERMLVLPNTVAEDFVSADRAYARAHFEVGDAFVLLTVARLDAREGYKGHDLVIAQLPLLKAQGRRILYLIAGQGDDRARLEQKARDAGVSGEVRFLGAVPRAQLPLLYCAADLFVMPSKGEGFGIAFLEAMASGTPALGLAIGGATDALGDGALGGAVTEAEFPDALHEAVQRSRPDGRVLSASVASRFGSAAFRRAVARMHDRVGADRRTKRHPARQVLDP